MVGVSGAESEHQRAGLGDAGDRAVRPTASLSTARPRRTPAGCAVPVGLREQRLGRQHQPLRQIVLRADSRSTAARQIARSVDPPHVGHHRRGQRGEQLDAPLAVELAARRDQVAAGCAQALAHGAARASASAAPAQGPAQPAEDRVARGSPAARAAPATGHEGPALRRRQVARAGPAAGQRRPAQPAARGGRAGRAAPTARRAPAR